MAPQDLRVLRHIYDNQWVIGGGPATPWIGYQKLDGNWQWVDGGSTNPATTAWNAGEPNNAGGQETVAHIWRCHEPTKILMNDLSANQKKYYICEVKVL